MKKEKRRERLSFHISDLCCGDIDITIQRFTELKQALLDKGCRGKIIVNYDIYQQWGDDYECEINVVGERPETEEEFEARVNQLKMERKKAEEEKKKKEILELKRLYAKYGDPRKRNV